MQMDQSTNPAYRQLATAVNVFSKKKNKTAEHNYS